MEKSTETAWSQAWSKNLGLTSKELDMVNHPSHYTQGGIECLEAIKASMTVQEFRGYLKGNIMKYLWRYENKGNPLQDLQKAKFYLERLEKENE